DAVDLGVGIVGAEGRLEVGPRPCVPRRRAGDLRRQVPEAAMVVLDGAGSRRRVLRRALVEAAEREEIEVRMVDTDRAFVLHPGERPPGGVRASGEALHVLLAEELHDVAR